MSRTLLIASLALTVTGFIPSANQSSAMAQEETTSIRIGNRNNFAVLIKRNGLAPMDSSSDQADPNRDITVDNIPLASDQVFSAWSVDESNRCLGTYILKKATAASFNVSLTVGPNGFAAAQGAKAQPRGVGTPGGNQDEEVFAANLGVRYRQLRQADGTFWVVITQPPVANSPAATLGFEKGDIITALDQEMFRTPQDVLNHKQQTIVDFIDVNTKEKRRAEVFIP